MCDWIFSNGFHWLLREAHLYPHQQHHSWNKLGRCKPCLRLIISKVVSFSLFIKTRGSMESDPIVLNEYKILFFNSQSFQETLNFVLEGSSRPVFIITD